MSPVYESLRRLLSVLRNRGLRCLQILFLLWRRFARALGLHSSYQLQGPSEKPESVSQSTNVVSASYTPTAYSLDEHVPLAGNSRGSSSGRDLELDIRRTPRRQSTSPQEPFSPSGTTIVSSPLSASPRGSLPLPSQCKEEPEVPDPNLKASTPFLNRRYHSRSPPTLDACLIPAGPLAVSRGRKRTLPEEWKEFTHPEGQSYFLCVWHNDPPINIITEAYVYDQPLRQLVSSYANDVLELAAVEKWYLDPRNVDLVVDVDEDGTSCSYYFLDHENEVIFWLQEMNTIDLDFPEVSGQDHLRIYLRELYWLHQEYFPAHRDLPRACEGDLIATLTHSCIDVTTATTSTSSFDRSQLETILGALKNLKHAVGSHGQHNCIIARLWNAIYHARFINYYGERDARLYRAHMVVTEDPPSIVMKIIFLLLFDAPSTHLTTLNEFYIDKVLYSDGWRKFMEVLLNDWHDMILWATVVLAANMSFLAIFNSTEDVISENRAVTCSLVSTLSSTISIVIGLLHIRKHRPLSRTHASDGSQYLDDATHPSLGMRPLAIVYSLPYAFFMWSMVTFIAAILLFTFQSGVSSTSRALIGSIAAALGCTLVWVIAYFWKDELRLMDDFRGLRNSLSSLSPVALNRLVGNVAPRNHNPEAANTPIVKHWVRRTAEAKHENNTGTEGV